VRRSLIFCAACLFGLFQLPAEAQSSPQKEKAAAPKTADSANAQSEGLDARVEKYLRNLYAWGPDYSVKVGPAKPSAIPELLEVRVAVSLAGQSDTAVVYVSKNGGFLIRGELSDMSVDPFAETRSKLHVGGSPTLGPEDAKVTLFEFADFECPSCRQLDLILRDLLPHHPEVRLVFKHYPLTQIHPWAMTAAIASQCALQQSPAAFWKMHDAIFDAQEVISPSNVWDKLQDLGAKEGLDTEAYRACMINPETATKLNAIVEEGHELTITGTPTTFVNGRRLVGPDQGTLEQFIKFSEVSE
jgi:protein-disulfide isomerase